MAGNSTRVGYHKLKSPSHTESVLKEGLKPSTPAGHHWLGEGVYFFLDPNGHRWAYKWPMNDYKPGTNSTEGILSAELDLRLALDLTDNEIRQAVERLVNTVKLKLRFVDRASLPISDGTIFAAIFRYGVLSEVLEFAPTAILANFDETYKQLRIANSRVFLVEGAEPIFLEETAQIQACIIDTTVIGKLTIVGKDIK